MCPSHAVRALRVMTLILVLTARASLAIGDEEGEILHSHGDMNCLVGSPFDPDADTMLTNIEFWYGVENTVDDTNIFAFEIESKIYGAAIASISWCHQYNGGRRVAEENGDIYFLDRRGRRLGIMTVNSAPMDLLKADFTCPHELQTETKFCSVYQGTMTLLSHATDDLTMSIAAIQSGIKHAMDDDSLLDPSVLSTVNKIVYLGNNEAQVLAWGSGGDKPRGEDFDEEDNDKPLAGILTASIIGAALLALLLLLVRKKRTMQTQSRARQLEAVAAISSEESSHGADPPGSFHQGYYHYTKDGVRYLSPHCQTCIETERQLALGLGLETIAEDEEFMEGRDFRLVGANSKDLGGKHSTMNVHHCTSATCLQCGTAKDPTFLCWRKQHSNDVTSPDAAAASGAAEGDAAPRVSSPQSRKGSSLTIEV